MKVYIKDGYLIFGRLEIPATLCSIEWDQPVELNPTKFRLWNSIFTKPILTDQFINITDCVKESDIPYTDYASFMDLQLGVGSFFLKAPSGVTAEALGAYGFTNNALGKVDRSTSTLSFENSSLTFTITPVGAYSFFYASIKDTIKEIKSVPITDTEGKWYFYFDETSTLVATHIFSDELILKQVLVASIYWNAIDKTIVGDIFDERHGYLQDGETHLQLHKALRTRYDGSGLGLNSFIIGDGSLDSHAQFIVGAGKIHDEDLDHNIPESTNTIPILYSLGSPTTIRTITNTGFAVTTAGTGRLAYNKASDNSLAEVTEGYYVAYHTFGMSGSDINSGQLFSIMGRYQYATLELAVEGAKAEIALIRVSYLLSNEMKDLGSEIFHTSDSYINAVKAKIVDVATGKHYLDWRFDAAIPGNQTQGDHDASNPKLAASGVQFGHIDDTDQNIVGNKIFKGNTKTKTLILENLTTLPILEKGQMAWNEDKFTISIGTEIPGSTREVGESDIYGYNINGSDMPNCTVVYISGSVDNLGLTYKKISKAIADTETNGFKSLAVTTNIIANGTLGRCTVHGDIGSLNTSGRTSGDIVYLSPTIEGEITYIKPVWPQAVVHIGQVGKVHATEGTIYVSIDKIVDVQATIDSNSLVPNTRTVNGHALTTDVIVTKNDVGLSNVDNESKTTMFTSPTFTGTITGITKSMVGLSNVDNTSDANKPVSDATVIALSGKINNYTSKTQKYFLAAPNNVDGIPDFRLIIASDIPTLNQSTSGTASNVSGTPALPNGTSATTQATGDNTTKLATDAFVQIERALDMQLAGTQTATGDKTFSGKIDNSGAQFMTGIISPTSLTATANNYDPLGFAMCNIIRQDATANRNISGFAAQANGFIFTLLNISGSSLTLQNNNAGSTIANRILTPNAANLVIRTGGSAQLWYDGITAAWRIYSAAI